MCSWQTGIKGGDSAGISRQGPTGESLERRRSSEPAGPESWRVGRETYLQASTGERAGWVLSRESYPTGCRRRSLTRKATSVTSSSRDVSEPGEVADPRHARKHLARNPVDPAVGLVLYARSARRIHLEYVRDERRREVGQAHSTEEAPEQRRGRHPRWRRGWREGVIGQGKSAQTGRTWTQRQNGTAPTEGADTQRLLCVNTRGRSPVR